MDWKREIIKTIKSLSGRYSEYEIFSDWVKCAAISVSNTVNVFHGGVWQQREKDYIAVMQKYNADEAEKFAQMNGMLALALEDDMSDVLGAVYMESGAGSKAAGQFFTPFTLSYVCAKMNLPDVVDAQNPLTLNEPSCGGGGMIIAAAKALKERGIDYQTGMKVVAQDLDWKAVYMCYLQCSLLGIDAVVVQGDTLKEPYCKEMLDPSRVFYTPRRLGAFI